MAEKEQKELYKFPVVKPATEVELQEISDKLGLKCTDAEIKEFRDYMNHIFADDYERLMKLTPPTLPVKYPRTAGYKPQPEENVYNAWFWKCDIKGAPEGILKGKKIAIKDNCCVAGIPMINGSTLLEGYVPEVDATIVTRILDAGGNIAGKANCEFMCFSGSSFTNSTGPTLNPYDVTRSAGGSSGGSAALVQTGDVNMAIGGDQGGSIRIPSCWCGTVGLKPTWGLVPYTGAIPIEISMDHLGPIARTVKDCALLLEAIAGYDDGLDPRQPKGIKGRQYSRELADDMKGKKVGIVTEGFEKCDEDVTNVVMAAANSLAKVGAQVEEVSIPLHREGSSIWGPACTEGAYKCMVKGNGNGHHWKGFYVESFQEALFRGYQTKSGDMSDIMKYLCLYCEYVNKRYGNKFYARSQNMSILLSRAYDAALQTYDVLVMPTLPYKAPKLPNKSFSLIERIENAIGMVKNTSPFDSTGHPALTINAGFSEGLPIGMMIIGKHFDETSVLQAAFAFERVRDGK